MKAKVAQHRSNSINRSTNAFCKANSNREDLRRRYDPQEDNIGKIIEFINNEFEDYECDDIDFGLNRAFDDDFKHYKSNNNDYEIEEDYARGLRDRSYSGGFPQSESRSERLPSKEEQVNSGRDSKTEPNS